MPARYLPIRQSRGDPLFIPYLLLAYPTVFFYTLHLDRQVALVVFKTGGNHMVSQKTDAEWFSMIQECRSSGRTVKEWCQEHAISVYSFYYNARRLRKIGFTIPVSSNRQSVLQKQEIVPLTVTGDEGAIPGCIRHSHPVSCAALSFVIEGNGISITCPDGISASTICSVVHALRSGC